MLKSSISQTFVVLAEHFVFEFCFTLLSPQLLSANVAKNKPLNAKQKILKNNF